jgi:hypothetical protein
MEHSITKPIRQSPALRRRTVCVVVSSVVCRRTFRLWVCSSRHSRQRFMKTELMKHQFRSSTSAQPADPTALTASRGMVKANSRKREGMYSSLAYCA